MGNSVKVVRRFFPALILASVEAFVALVCVLSGLPILVNPDQLAPGSVTELFPGWTIYVWATGLIVGGLTSLAGIILTEYRIERIGVLALITTVGTFSFALVGELPGSFMWLLTFILFTLAMAARYWLLGRLISIQKMRLRYIEEHRNGGRD